MPRRKYFYFPWRGFFFGICKLARAKRHGTLALQDPKGKYLAKPKNNRFAKQLQMAFPDRKIKIAAEKVKNSRLTPIRPR